MGECRLRLLCVGANRQELDEHVCAHQASVSHRVVYRAVSMGMPKASRKGKKAWRKNIDAQEVGVPTAAAAVAAGAAAVVAAAVVAAAAAVVAAA
jgi:hypothetical protein